MRRGMIWVGLVGLALGIGDRASAQVVSDRTLNTIVTPLPGNNFVITGGRVAGSNLFHSFRSFSIPTRGSATFNLTGTSGISTIFSRVTGSNLSNIDGRLISPVNLFLLNPNGVIFGANAQLLIGGSFLGTTASSVQFADGVEFTAASTPNVLTMSAPIGLQFGQNSGAIQVQGNGHSLASRNTITAANVQNPLLYPYLPTNFSISGLWVAPGRTLALVGGDVALNGGIVAAPGGRVEIGSVETGNVGIRTTPQGFTLDYSVVPALKNIDMSQRSLIDVGALLDQTGRTAGSIQVQGNNIRLRDGSVLLSQHRSIRPAGEITVRANETLELLGTNANETIMSGIVSETYGLAPGKSSPINVSARNLVMRNGGVIQTRSYSPAPGGDVNINISDSIDLQGTSPNTRVFNAIGGISYYRNPDVTAPPITTGKAGNVTVSARQLSMQDASTIVSLSFGDADGGAILVNTDQTRISGGVKDTPEPIGDMPSSLLSISYLRGNSGTITLNTRTLELYDGATISTTNLGRGNSGTVKVNASDSILLSSEFAGYDAEGELVKGYSNISSTIGSSTYNRQLLNPTELVNGTAGGVTIKTPTLNLNLAGIGVGNYGVGSAGTLDINANAIRISNGGGLSATSFSGEGGDIQVKAQTLVMQNNAQIVTNAAGNGGNIQINSRFIAGAGNSDIVANAVQGRGGNIQITTEGIFGLAFRDLQNPREVQTNDITASSEFSTNGDVQISTPDVDPNSGLVELPTEVSDPTRKIGRECAAIAQSRFVLSGRGGVPINPMQELSQHPTVWHDLRVPSMSEHSIAPESGMPLVEATNWQRNTNTGKVELIAGRLMTSPVSNCNSSQIN